MLVQVRLRYVSEENTASKLSSQAAVMSSSVMGPATVFWCTMRTRHSARKHSADCGEAEAASERRRVEGCEQLQRLKRRAGHASACEHASVAATEPAASSAFCVLECHAAGKNLSLSARFLWSSPAPPADSQSAATCPLPGLLGGRAARWQCKPNTAKE